MKRFATAAVAAASVALTLSLPLSAAQKGMTPEQEKAWKERVEIRLKKTGGIVDIPGSQKGTIRFVNAQSRVSETDLARILSVFTGSMCYDAKIVKGASVDALTAESARRAAKADVAVFLVDDAKGVSTMLVSPEERWAIVNIARLVPDNPAKPFVAARARKELLRAMAFLTAGSSYDNELMQPIRKPSDLDEVSRERYPIDVITRTTSYLDHLGVTAQERDTYKAVLEYGIDLAPTNDYQKAIYEKFKSDRERGPANGIKIAPPKAK